MNTKELSELRRRFKPEKSAISRIYGCYANTRHEIISTIDAPLGLARDDEVEKYLGLLRKTLSGSMGRNLLDISFSTQQVMDSPEHKLLSALCSSGLQDEDTRNTFYDTVVKALNVEHNYLILIAQDAYDVPRKGKDLLPDDGESDSTFRYMVCAVCPVKDGKSELRYDASTGEFHTSGGSQVVGAPEFGFLFPTFDDRATNLYAALYYTRSTADVHQDFIDAVFHTDSVMMSASDQRTAFDTALADSLEDSCSLDVMKAVHDQLRDRIQQHKESKDPDPLTISPEDVGNILASCGVREEQVTAFQESCSEQFGNTALSPANLIDTGRFLVEAPHITISVAPEHSHLIRTRILDGRKYILIPADSGVTVNGVNCEISEN